MVFLVVIKPSSVMSRGTDPNVVVVVTGLLVVVVVAVGFGSFRCFEVNVLVSSMTVRLVFLVVE